MMTYLPVFWIVPESCRRDTSTGWNLSQQVPVSRLPSSLEGLMHRFPTVGWIPANSSAAETSPRPAEPSWDGSLSGHVLQLFCVSVPARACCSVDLSQVWLESPEDSRKLTSAWRFDKRILKTKRKGWFVPPQWVSVPVVLGHALQLTVGSLPCRTCPSSFQSRNNLTLL